MNGHYLDFFFNPRIIAVIGASNRPSSAGRRVFTNLLESDFVGEIYPVNPKHRSILHKKCYPAIDKISPPIDLAIIVTPAQTVWQVIKECGIAGIPAALVLTAGFSEMGEEGKKLEKKMLEASTRFNVRIIGPNCLGLIIPHHHLNATFNNVGAQSGNLALVSQSGAICAAILDWAFERNIGFSAMVSLGNSADVDFSDVLDYLSRDSKTKSILLYIEGIRHARSFMSSLRAAARLKPVVIIKGGRFQQGSRAALSHTGAIVGRDDVFDAALKRAGAVRVMSIDELFSAAKMLASDYRAQGRELVIITNGGGAGVMAADRAAELNIPLLELGKESVARLNDDLPPHWSHANPIDVIGDATPKRYRQVIQTCLLESNACGLVIILVPVAMSEPDKVAEEVIALTKNSNKPVIACWMGEHQIKSARAKFEKSRIPCYNTPEEAVEAFSYLANYFSNQRLLLQAPEPLHHESQTDTAGAELVIESVLATQRNVLTLNESKAVLSAFHIPFTPSIEANTANQALVAAESLGYPVAMKIFSSNITHKQAVGGVQLNIQSGEEVREAFKSLINRVKAAKPEANLQGVTIERMHQHPNNRELIIGVAQDPVFGPIISFGAGGTFVEEMNDIAVALPPLNRFLAKQLIQSTRIAALLQTHRKRPAVDLTAIENMLLQVSDMICELPQLKELDLNPVLANEKEVIAADARMVVDYAAPSLKRYHHLAIHPYPKHLISRMQLPDATEVIIRPVRPEDTEIEAALMKRIALNVHFTHFSQSSKKFLPCSTQIDYDREMAFIAVVTKNQRETCIGIARYVINPEQSSCEFAVVVEDKWQGKGIGSRLLIALMKEAKNQGVQTITGEVSVKNERMLKLIRQLEFEAVALEEDASIQGVKKILL